MLIWLFFLVLFGCAGLAGWSFGVIRAAFSFAGLMIGLLLARMFGHSLDKVLGSFGVKNPAFLWVLGPFIVLVLTVVVFKIVGYVANTKMDVYYKYKAGDLRLALWNRLSQRLGLCVALVNASVYLVLTSMAIYTASYVTVQTVEEGKVSRPVWLLNAAGSGLKSTGLDKVVAAIDPVPADFYGVMDLVGLIYHNDLLEGRLARYPAFLALGERPEFQALATDQSFTELRQRQPPIMEIVHYSKMEALTTPDMLKELWGLVVPNLKDLNEFLLTGKSAKYDGEKILGRWDVNLTASLAAARDVKPNITSTEMRNLRTLMTALFSTTVLVATPENLAFLKNVGKQVAPPPGMNQQPTPAPQPQQPPPGGRGGRRGGRGGGNPPPATRAPALPVAAPPPMQVVMQNLQGKWSSNGANYSFRFDQGGTWNGVVEGEKLTVSGPLFVVVLDRE